MRKLTPKLTDEFGLKAPVIQAPMAGGIIPANFVAAVCEFGMIGSIAGGYLSLEQMEAMISQVQQRTPRPFALNIFVDNHIYPAHPLLKPPEIVGLEKQLGIYRADHYMIQQPPSVSDIIDLVCSMQVPVLSTTFDLLEKDHIHRLKTAGVRIMTTVNSTREIEPAIESQQADYIIFQSEKAGGHKGGFMDAPYSSQEDILAFMQNYPSTGCVIAGGIIDHADLQTVMQKGADGVQMGTGFLLTKESTAAESYKTALLTCTDPQGTDFTRNITGRSARGLKNKIARHVIQAKIGFPHLHFATADLRAHARQTGQADFQSLWSGSTVHKINDLKNLEDFMKSLCPPE